MLAAGRSVIQRLCAAFFCNLRFYPGVVCARYAARARIACIYGGLEFGGRGKDCLLRQRRDYQFTVRCCGFIMQVFVLPSSLRATRVPAALSLRGVVQLVLHLTLAGTALLVLLHTRQLVGTTRLIGRLGRSRGVLLCRAFSSFLTPRVFVSWRWACL